MIEMNVTVRVQFDPAVELLFQSLAAAIFQGAPLNPHSVGPAPRNCAVEDAAANGQHAAAPAAGVSSLNLPLEPKAPEVFFGEDAHGVRDKWTPDRVALLIEMALENHKWDVICAEVNCLAGPKITTGNAVYVKYKKLVAAGLVPARTGELAPPAAPVAEKPVPVAEKPVEVVTPSVTAARDKTPNPKPLNGHKIRVSIAEARAWAAQRGLCNGFESDLDMKLVNAKRTELGLPLFDLIYVRGAA